MQAVPDGVSSIEAKEEPTSSASARQSGRASWRLMGSHRPTLVTACESEMAVEGLDEHSLRGAKESRRAQRCSSTPATSIAAPERKSRDLVAESDDLDTYEISEADVEKVGEWRGADLCVYACMRVMCVGAVGA